MTCQSIPLPTIHAPIFRGVCQRHSLASQTYFARTGGARGLKNICLRDYQRQSHVVGNRVYQPSAHGMLAPTSIHKPTQRLVHSLSTTSSNSAGTSPPKDSCNTMPAYIPCATQPGPQYKPIQHTEHLMTMEMGRAFTKTMKMEVRASAHVCKLTTA